MSRIYAPRFATLALVESVGVAYMGGFSGPEDPGTGNPKTWGPVPVASSLGKYPAPRGPLSLILLLQFEHIRERGRVLYLGMATENLNLPCFCITQIMAKATTSKPSMQRE